MCHESSFLAIVLWIIMFTKITEQCSHIEYKKESEVTLYSHCPNTEVTENPFDLFIRGALESPNEKKADDIISRRSYCQERQQKVCNTYDRTLTTKKKLKGSKNHRKRLKKKKKYRKKKKNKLILQ